MYSLLQKNKLFIQILNLFNDLYILMICLKMFHMRSIGKKISLFDFFLTKIAGNTFQIISKYIKIETLL